MRLLVLGATGGVGVELVRQAAEQGHSVTTLVRNASRLRPFAARISVVEGDVLSADTLRHVVVGQEAVLSGFGPRLPIAKADHDLLQRFAGTLTEALESASVRRAIVVSTAFLFRDAVLPPAYLVGRLFFPSVVRDSAAMEDIVRRSNLEWTMVRPPRLTDKAASQKYRVREDYLPRFGFHISRADVASFMLDEVKQNRHVRKIVGVCH